MTRVPKDQGECREIRPAPMFRKAFTVGKPVAAGAALLVGARLPRPLRERRARLRQRARPAVHRLQQDRPLHDRRRHGPVAPGRKRPRLRAGGGQVRRRRADLGLGLAQGAVARHPAAAPGPVRHVHGRDGAGGAVGRFLEGQRRRAEALRQHLPGRDLRRPPRDRWLEAGRLRRRALGGGTRGGRARRRPARSGGRADARGGGAAAGDADGAFSACRSSTTWARTSAVGRRVRVRAPAGTAVEIFYSEILENGRASTKGNGLVGGQLQTDYYIARGEGEETVGASLQLQRLPVRPAQRTAAARPCRKAFPLHSSPCSRCGRG